MDLKAFIAILQNSFSLMIMDVYCPNTDVICPSYVLFFFIFWLIGGLR